MSKPTKSHKNQPSATPPMRRSTPPRLAKTAKAKNSSQTAAKSSEIRKLPPTHKRPSPADVNKGTNSSKKAKPAKDVNIFPLLEVRRETTTKQLRVPKFPSDNEDDDTETENNGDMSDVELMTKRSSSLGKKGGRSNDERNEDVISKTDSDDDGSRVLLLTGENLKDVDSMASSEFNLSDIEDTSVLIPSASCNSKKVPNYSEVEDTLFVRSIPPVKIERNSIIHYILEEFLNT